MEEEGGEIEEKGCLGWVVGGGGRVSNKGWWRNRRWGFDDDWTRDGGVVKMKMIKRVCIVVCI